MLYTKRLSEKTYQLFCQGCLEPVDIIDSDCVAWHLRMAITGDPRGDVFCFDCDGDDSNCVPLQLQIDDGEVLAIFDEYGRSITVEICRDGLSHSSSAYACPVIHISTVFGIGAKNGEQ